MATWFITGCSSGLGRSLAQVTLQAGHNVVVTARTEESVHEWAGAYRQTALVVPLDVTDAGQVTDAVHAAEDRFGGIDVLVNNAGYGYRAAVEEGEEQAIAGLFATNFFGPIRLIKAVLPLMRARRRGTIVNVSSSGVRTSPPGSGYYVASKAALEGLSESLLKEVAPFGIHVLIVEPGAFRTDFAGRSLTQPAQGMDDYVDTVGRRRKEHDTDHGHQPGDPDRAARAILTAVAHQRPPGRLLLGADAFDAMTRLIAEELDEVNAWRATTLGTGFPLD